MDEATPNKRWVDSSGDVSPTGIWYYEVTAYDHVCLAEGPFWSVTASLPGRFARDAAWSWRAGLTPSRRREKAQRSPIGSRSVGS